MAKVVVELSMSLDGFIAGPNDNPENGLGFKQGAREEKAEEHEEIGSQETQSAGRHDASPTGHRADSFSSF